MYNYGLGAALPISLTLDTPYQQVGRPGKYRIIGAPPNANIYWSSYKNNQATGELNADYGHKTEPNGTAELETTWLPEHVGTWTKEILIKDAAGAMYTAKVDFIVQPESAAAPAPGSSTAPAAGGIFDKGFYIGEQLVPYWIPVTLALFFVFKK